MADMAELGRDPFTPCDRVDCFGNVPQQRRCYPLNSTDFGGRPCPFYKPLVQLRAERERYGGERGYENGKRPITLEDRRRGVTTNRPRGIEDAD